MQSALILQHADDRRIRSRVPERNRVQTVPSGNALAGWCDLSALWRKGTSLFAQGAPVPLVLQRPGLWWTQRLSLFCHYAHDIREHKSPSETLVQGRVSGSNQQK